MKIAFLGLGTMGAPMAQHLTNAGHELYVFNRTSSKADKWIRTNPNNHLCFSPSEACQEVDCLILCAGNDESVRELLFGDRGASKTLKQGTIVIDHTTTSADLAKEMHKRLNDLQIDYVDAPVSGGQQGAINGQLTIMCGGDKPAAQRCEGICQPYTKGFSHMGAIGNGQTTKMVNQICVAGVVQGLAEGIHFAQQNELDVEQVMTLIAGGAAGSWQMVNRHKTMAEDRYDHGFAIDLMRKDLGICLDNARKNQINLPITALIDQFYCELQNQGEGQSDTSVLLKRLQKKA